MSELPIPRGTTLPADMLPGDILANFERLEQIVTEQRRRRDQEEAEARVARVAAAEEEDRKRYWFGFGNGSRARIAERQAISDQAYEEWKRLQRHMVEELGQIDREFRQKVAACKAKWQAQQGEVSRAAETKCAAILERQRREFDAAWPEFELKLQVVEAERLTGKKPAGRR